jgi:hypothetical protein
MSELRGLKVYPYRAPACPEFGDPFPALPDNLLQGGSPGLTRSEVARRLGVSVTRVDGSRESSFTPRWGHWAVRYFRGGSSEPRGDPSRKAPT